VCSRGHRALDGGQSALGGLHHDALETSVLRVRYFLNTSDKDWIESKEDGPSDRLRFVLLTHDNLRYLP